jgi:hypothetical protein
MLTATALRKAVDELLGQPEPALSPPTRIPPVLAALDPSWAPSILVIGGALPARDEHELRRRGCRIHPVGDLASGLDAMSSMRWDAVAVSAGVQSETDGLRFVRSFKCRDPAELPAAVGGLAVRYLKVPFIVLPLPGTTEFAVFRSGFDWRLGDAAANPIASIILRGMPEQ